MGATNVVVCDSGEHDGWLSDMDKAEERRIAYWADKVWDVRCMWANYRAAAVWNEALAESMLTEIQIELSAVAYGLYPDRAIPIMLADVPLLVRSYRACVKDYDRAWIED